jgi:hypothetical protein
MILGSRATATDARGADEQGDKKPWITTTFEIGPQLAVRH